VEGRRAHPGDVRQPGLRCEAPAAPGVRHLWAVRRALRPPPGALSTTDEAGGISAYDELRRALGDPDLDPELLDRALTHRSYAYENGGIPTNERLEFLGDAVLGVVVTETLYRAHPDLPEGRLAKLRAAVVNARALAEVARGIGLGRFIKLGRGEEATGGREKASILADTTEALLGAVHLTGGIEVSSQVVHRLFDPLIDEASRLGAGLDWKTSLQELSAEHELGVPEYVIEDEGPDHQKTFTAQVRVGDQLYGNGVGRSKKEAEQGAAETAYVEIAARLAAAGSAGTATAGAD
jgi:ribonuclease-3